MVEAVGGDDGCGGGVVAEAERETEAGAQQSLSGGGLAPVAVYYPHARSGTVAAYGGEEQIVGVHVVYYQGLVQAGGEAGVEVEHGLLHGDVASAQAVDAAFAYGHDARVAGGGHEGAQSGECDGALGVPRVYAHAVCASGQHRLAGAQAHDGAPGAGPVGVVGVYVGVSGEGLGHGTGSYPLPPQGWQRSRRFTVSHVPRMAPWRRKASRAYWLHVGVKRHDCGNIGDIEAR